MRLADGLPLNTLGLAHSFLARYVRPGDYCIDATAGQGRDTAYLCRLVGEKGRVLAFDIQPQAVAATEALLAREGHSQARVVLDSHSNLAAYAQPGSVDCVVFNFGWLPGGDHSIYTQSETSLAAMGAGLELLRSGGVMSLCIYHGDANGYAERDAILAWLEALDDKQYTVVVSRFVNRKGDVPIPVFVFKE